MIQMLFILLVMWNQAAEAGTVGDECFAQMTNKTFTHLESVVGPVYTNMTLDECLESCVRMKKCMAFTHLGTDNSCNLFNFFPDLGGKEKEIPCKGPCVTRYIGLPQFCYTISTDYPFYRQHVNRLDDCYTYGILCKNHYMLQDEVNRSLLELQRMKKEVEDEVNRSRLELQRMKKENEEMSRQFEQLTTSQIYEVQEKIVPLRQVLFELSPATLIEEENKSRQTTLIYFATQTVSEIEKLKSLIEKSPEKDNDDLKSSANRFETLMQICEKILTDTKNQFPGYLSFLLNSEAETFLSLHEITIRNPDKDNDDYKSIVNRIETLKSEKTATLNKIEKLYKWTSRLSEVMLVFNEKPLLEWIDFGPETVLDMLSDLKSSCQDYKTQT